MAQSKKNKTKGTSAASGGSGKAKPVPIVKPVSRSRRSKAAGAKKNRAGNTGGKWPRLKQFTRRFIKWLMITGIVLSLFLVALTFIYKSSSVRPISTLMISKWMQGEKVSRTWVPMKDISPFVYQSVISSEDGKFCIHNGVDWDAVNIVIDDLMEGESPRGASTIPMQTVKNVYLWSSRSYVRKVLEVPLALLIDAVWDKRRTMEIYLNIAEWGPGIYGIEAASQYHFQRSASRLTRRQAAMLAVTLPNPKLRNPRRPKQGMRRLARLVERRAKASGAYVKCVK